MSDSYIKTKRDAKNKALEHLKHPSSLFVLALGALGVVFGDIGTSPLYALRECFDAEHGLVLNHDNVMGVLSLIFWTLMMIINLKYMLFVLFLYTNQTTLNCSDIFR